MQTAFRSITTISSALALLAIGAAVPAHGATLPIQVQTTTDGAGTALQAGWDLVDGGRHNNNTSPLILTLSGLADGTYQITTYHHSMYVRSATANGLHELDVLLTDANGTDVLVHDNMSNSFGDTVTTATIATAVTQFTVSGGNDVTLKFRPEAANFSSDDINFLNGFELAVPSPDHLPCSAWAVCSSAPAGDVIK